MKRVLVLSLVLTFALLTFIPVSAAPPFVDAQQFHSDHMVWDTLCPGFEVWDDEVGSYRYTEYYDKNGDLLRWRVHYVAVDKFYNKQDPGVVLNGHWSASWEYDARSGQVAAQGMFVNITLPGYGIVLLQAGRQPEFPYGPVLGHDSFANPDEVALFCSLLAND